MKCITNAKCVEFFMALIIYRTFRFMIMCFLKDYICPQCEEEIEEDYEVKQEEEFHSKIEKALKINNLIK